MRLHAGLTWNLSAFAVTAICGLLINVVIARYYGPEALGVFNQAFAVYLVMSQLANLGVWMSALKHVSEHAGDPRSCSSISAAALAIAAVGGLVFTALGVALVKPLSIAFGSAAVASAWLFIVPGLLPYSLNKVHLAILNGHGDMRGYALAQMFRYLLIAGGLIAAVRLELRADMLTLAVSIPEILLLFALAWYLRRYRDGAPFGEWRVWLMRHLRFGIKGMPGGVLGELNTRVDIVILGLFHADIRVGIYSMAAIIAEGLALTSAAVRDTVNPLLARLYAQGKLGELEALVRKVVRLYAAALIAVLVIVAAGYPWIVALLSGSTAFAESWYPFLLLAIGLALSGGYLPVNMLLAQAGQPHRQTQHRFGIFLVNVTMGLALVPLLEVPGAALAASISFLFSAAYLRHLARRHLRLSI